MQGFLNFIWKNGLLSRRGMKTTTGEPIEVEQPGNEEKCGLFTNARIMIDGCCWSGNVVLHLNSSDWEKEITRKKSQYENVILHVTLNDNVETLRRNGEAVHQLRLQCPIGIIEEYGKMLNSSFALPCGRIAASLSNIKLHSFLSQLTIERIEEKAERIAALHNLCNKRWDDTLFKLLARSFGFGIQGHLFEKWATLLDMQALAKHRDNIEQVEAIFFGQAGLLNEESIPTYYRSEALASEYYNTLVREYRFLKGKFNLQELDYKEWGNHATPHIRIARLASLYHREKINIATAAACETIEELHEKLQVQPSWYWQHRTQFGSTVTIGTGDINKKQLDILIINAIIPILYCYGKHRKDIDICNKAEDYLHTIDSESNNITRRWTEQGVAIGCAADSQALIQLNNSYCNKHRCHNCQFAYSYFKNRVAVC